MIDTLGSTTLLAQGFDGADAAAAGGGIIALVILAIELGIAILMIAGMWKAFAKAGKPGWAAIIPIYNIIVILEITGKPIWWIVLCLIPCVNIVIILIILMDVGKSFGVGAGFGVGLFFLGFIFWPILGFGDSKYIGPVAAES